MTRGQIGHVRRTLVLYTARMFRTYRHIFFLTCAAALLSGCGLKGPLYLPEERARQQAEREQQKKARANRESSSATNDTSGNAPSDDQNTTSTAPATPTDTTHAPASPTPPPRN
jgi:predicted small lipoprotein YifL